MLTSTADGMKKLHGLVELAFSRSLGTQVSIGASHQDWAHKAFGQSVVFRATCGGARRIDFGSRAGQPAIELPGFGDGDKAWCTWQEEWSTEPNEPHYELIAAGFTFFWGSYKPEEILFRAEWTCDRENQRAKAAHPHWHFDCQLPSENLTIDRLHLGMGGWESAGEDTACWQRFPADVKGLALWASRTLDYSFSQLIAYPLSKA